MAVDAKARATTNPAGLLVTLIESGDAEHISRGDDFSSLLGTGRSPTPEELDIDYAARREAGAQTTGATAPAPTRVPESVQRLRDLRAAEAAAAEQQATADYAEHRDAIEHWATDLPAGDYPQAMALSGVNVARWADLSPAERYRAWRHRPPTAADYARGPTTMTPKIDYPVDTDAAKARLREQAAALKAGQA